MSGPMTVPTIVSSTASKSSTSMTWALSRPPRTRHMPLQRKLASMAANPTMVATISRSRVSWFLTWLSSWEITPSSSSRFIISNSPVVTVTAACSGLSPVANAFGEGSSTT